MKLTITTLVIIEDTTDLSVPERSICYHSFFEDIEKAKAKRNPRSKPNRYNHNRYNITTMKKKDIIYIPGQDKWSEHFPTPGKLRPSNFGHIFGDTQSQFNKLLRTQQKLRNKKK